MKKEELRIGNWVRHYLGWSYRVDENEPEEFDFQWEDRDWLAVGESCLEIERIEPIPLTEEWLIKFGLAPSWMPAVGDTWKFTITDDTLNSFVFKRGGVKIEFVHQLQNLWFALTGEELTLKP